ncbi:hypothetical protein [Saccharothrix algeriensis]|uniref:Uncharacterized protein n=1 Tax=Saccharothrix algeriensis TaxID=173560 RepID=A0A8T8HVN7_9PSEU|nr:hypothetical protein [Saccharothrix algeriensis]MBM7814169.1 hypothetical protein [Saccharothrix algeriensis]QTR02536.1 hypothetical protein J7S33_26085 [Saccharothrix algeriensis]
MSVRTPIRPVVTPEDVAELVTAAVEPETEIADPPLYAKPASLLILLLLSPSTPKEPSKR